MLVHNNRNNTPLSGDWSVKISQLALNTQFMKRHESGLDFFKIIDCISQVMSCVFRLAWNDASAPSMPCGRLQHSADVY